MQTDSAILKLRSFFLTNKRLPSYREMCSLLGFCSKKTSFELVKKLVREGILEKDEYGKLIPKRLFPPLPVLGTIHAGHPSSSEQSLLETMSFDNYLVNKPEKSYILKVSGDSMIDAGINSGDFVVIEKDKQPSQGDIVVAYIDGEFTLKYFTKNDGKILLMPANKKYSPLSPMQELSIFGVVVSVMRKYH